MLAYALPFSGIAALLTIGLLTFLSPSLQRQGLQLALLGLWIWLFGLSTISAAAALTLLLPTDSTPPGLLGSIAVVGVVLSISGLLLVRFGRRTP